MRQRNTTTWKNQDICKGIQLCSLWVFSTTQTFSSKTGHIFLSQPTDPSRNVVLGFGVGGVWINTQSAGFSVQLTSSPVELGISGRVSVGEDGRAGESRVGQRGRQSLVALFCRAGEGWRCGGKVAEKKDKKGWTLVPFHDISQWNVARPSTWVQKEPNHWHISRGPSFIQAAWIM